jgi:hypothetical protein
MTVLPTAVVATMHSVAKVPFTKAAANIGRALKLYSKYRWGGKWGVTPFDVPYIKKLFDVVS